MISKLLLGIFLGGLPFLLFSQTWKDVPVYPNATLNTTVEQGEEATCCGFSTTDPLDKVVAFYEAALKTKALDIPTLGAKYPAMKAQLQQMKQQLPPDARFVALVISEAGYGGAPGPMLFQILSMQGRTNFSLSEQDLGFSGARFVHEYRKATNTMDNLDQYYESWYISHPIAKQEQLGFPVYPGSLAGITVGDKAITDFTNFNLRGEKCYELNLCILDTLAFEKVVAFYKDKLKGQFKEVPADDAPAGLFKMEDKQFFWKEAPGAMEEFHGKQGDVNRTLWIELGGIPQYPYFDRVQMTRVAGPPIRCIVVTLTSVMLGTCEEFPKETRRHRVIERD